MNSRTKRISKKIRKNMKHTDLKGLDKYIEEKYGKILEVYCDGKTPEQEETLISSFADDEILFLSGFPESEIRNALKPDKELNAVINMSAEIFDEAKDCVKKGITLSDKNRYEKIMLALSNHMQEVNYRNRYTARTFYSIAVLDLNYMYGKSSSMSLRLALVK